MLSMILKQSVMKVPIVEARCTPGMKQLYLRCNKDTMSPMLSVRNIVTKCPRLIGGLERPVRLLMIRKSPQNLPVRCQQTIQLDINTNVNNNVILFKDERTKYFRNLLIFTVVQLCGWFLLAAYTYSPSFFDIFKANRNLHDYLKFNLFRLSFFILSIIVGPLFCLLIYGLRARCIKYIILNKGGTKVTFITYHIQKEKSTITVPVNMVECVKQRTDVGVYVSFKVLNTKFYYLIDKKGQFLNTELFDHTIGHVRNSRNNFS